MMKKEYRAPEISVMILNTESPFMVYSDQKTESPYEDIPTDILNGNDNYQEGNGDDAG